MILKTKGFSFIELMSALSISSIIFSLLVSMYTHHMHAQKLAQAYWELQIKLLKFSEVLGKDIQQAGKIGCKRLSRDYRIFDSEHSEQPYNFGIFADSNSNLTIHYASPKKIIPEAISSDGLKIYVNHQENFEVNRKYLISNCHYAELFYIKKIIHHHNKMELILNNALKNNFNAAAEIAEWISHRYLIKPSPFVRQRKEYSLYLQKNRSSPQELINGIKSIRYQFTMKQHQQLSDFPAEVIQDWEKVKGVYIEYELIAPPLVKKFYQFIAIHEEQSYASESS